MRVHDITLTRDFSSDDLKSISIKAGRYLSEIILLKPDAVIDVKSLLGMMLSPLKKGFVITIRTKGKDEEEALDFMCEIMDSRQSGDVVLKAGEMV
ncbi:HPr family phosphocarrier protein [Paenibacillus apii]|uniref:HPr family phosphocarrier protein n=1 Tax=Paenibacillus apii TaxID=1850370 RepID=UPI001439020E|nr:HPr family phosphocarrier protein [Paenibacillus apii]NJJ42397.1 HPr family phosphocarrier protein [Paenibacillus apii]